MAPRIDDRWLWLGLGVVIILGTKGIAYALRDLEHITQITPPDPPKKPEVVVGARPVNPEDAISIESLATLARCNNHNIRVAAQKLFCKRFINNPAAMALLYQDLNAGGERQFQAKRAARLLVLAPLNARRHQAGQQEREQRRRRREAVVVNEGDRPVTQADIFQRE